jgi:hypothetical protein
MMVDVSNAADQKYSSGNETDSFSGRVEIGIVKKYFSELE